jgi:tetratricopeptide (TPR) repeat protein
VSIAASTTSLPLRWQNPEPVGPLSFAKVLPLLRAGVAAWPARPDLKLQLAKALFQAKQFDEILGRLRPEIADDGADPKLLYYVGRAALEVRDDRTALSALKQAADSDFAPAFGYLAEALQRLDRPDEALDAALKRLETAPSNFPAIKVVARVLLERGQAERLWTLCVDLRARGTWGSWFSAAMASAAAALGNDREFWALMNRPRWFSATSLPVAGDFNNALVTELLALRSDDSRPRVDDLEHRGGPAAQDLMGSIRACVDTYIAQRQVFTTDPMIVHRPASVSLRSWAITIHDHKHHGWHIHQTGWISGVYYVRTPELAPGDDTRLGAIEFGPYPFAGEEQLSRSYRWHVAPAPGLLVLFPSYYPHRTWPTGAADLRICVPFDVRPRERPQNERRRDE